MLPRINIVRLRRRSAKVWRIPSLRYAFSQLARNEGNAVQWRFSRETPRAQYKNSAGIVKTP
jgi:hypothetical protein